MSPTRNRVVITGLGAITPLGHDVETYWSALLAGRSGVAKIQKFDTTGHSVTFGSEVKDFDPGAHIDPKEAKRMDPFAQYAVAAAKQAVKDSGLDFQKEDRFRCGAIIASGIGGLHELQEQ
ncbi:MAG TPA: beta-ketoacyl synthase N-terminal-like domain-containing protein, partial [Planctomycetota bacterium]|nr:beta-ketoacyl synthase N-terminal-like domain-containing protein [Planctomycetota bacterium]